MSKLAEMAFGVGVIGATTTLVFAAGTQGDGKLFNAFVVWVVCVVFPSVAGVLIGKSIYEAEK